MDVLRLLDELEIEKAVFLGTSLGGLVTMIVATMAPQRIAGAMLNDVGPEIDVSGIDRIKSYVGKPVVFSGWQDAADQLRGRLGDVHPAYGDEAHYLHVYVSHLRSKIERDPSNPRVVLTEPGAGYRLVDPDAS